MRDASARGILKYSNNGADAHEAVRVTCARHFVKMSIVKHGVFIEFPGVKGVSGIDVLRGAPG